MKKSKNIISIKTIRLTKPFGFRIFYSFYNDTYKQFYIFIGGITYEIKRIFQGILEYGM